MPLSNAEYQKRWRDARRAEKHLLAEHEVNEAIKELSGAEREAALSFLARFGPIRFLRAAKRATAQREAAASIDKEAEEYIGNLHGVYQTKAIARLVQLGARRFIDEVAQLQRKERLKELREKASEPISPLRQRIIDARKAMGLKDWSPDDVD